MNLVYGKILPRVDISQLIRELTAPLSRVLQQTLPEELIYECASMFSSALQKGSLLAEVDSVIKQEVCNFCDSARLKRKVLNELGDNPWSLRRADLSRPNYEAWHPLGVVLHITPANAASLPFLALIEGLLAGNVNWLRPSRSDEGLTIKLAEAFLSCDETGMLKQYVSIIECTIEEISSIMDHADGVSAWGGDQALTSIRNSMPIDCRWIPWGHKISFAWLQSAAMENLHYEQLAAEICRFNQQACSSPQIVFVETDDFAEVLAVGEKLHRAFERVASEWAYEQPDQKSAADITSSKIFAELDQAFAEGQSRCWQGLTWSVLAENKTSIDPSPLYRHVLLRPLPKNQLIEALRPWRGYLQTCALQCRPDDVIEMSHLLIKACVNRITPMSGIHSAYDGEPHDGVYGLAQLLRRVCVTLEPDTLPRMAKLDCPPIAPSSVKGRSIMDKEAFTAQKDNPLAQLYFKSGGSVGLPKLSGFTYRDYHRQMQAAADGFFAAGLDPSTDRVMNLLYSGNLYGGMLSIFTTLDKVGVFQLPMGGPVGGDFSHIVSMIIDQRINTLVGMPSVIGQLFNRHSEVLRKYHGIRKLLTVGEHINTAQKRIFASFDIDVVHSAIYGSVDAGPIGYACKECSEGVFHLMSDIQWLEILKPTCDEPVSAGEIGRLVLTSRKRTGHEVIRYDIGDLGRWIDDPCPCGDPFPRFELMGRHGSIIRMGPILVNPHDLEKLAAVPVQFMLSIDPDTGQQILQVNADVGLDELEKLKERICSDLLIGMILSSGLVVLRVVPTPQLHFARHPQSGKTPIFIDKRS